MKKRICAAILFASGMSISGCSISGSWQIVSVEPRGAPFPLETLTFDNDNNYTATWSQDGRSRTTTGQYKWNGRSLEMGRQGYNPRKYRARRRLDGTLVMQFEHNDAKMTAILQKHKSAE